MRVQLEQTGSLAGPISDPNFIRAILNGENMTDQHNEKDPVDLSDFKPDPDIHELIMPKIEDGKLSNFRPQKNNSNAHTQRGLKALSDAYSEVGYVAPMTAAANGEVLDGSARLEQAFDQFEDEALVIRHDGRRPIIMVREDVEDADDPRAKRISYGANRIGEIDLVWNPNQLLIDKEAGVDFNGLFHEDEFDEITADVKKEPSEESPPPVDKAAELQEIWQTQLGQIWQLGPHKIACDDCTDRQTVSNLFDGQLADLWLTDPPYGISYADKNAFLNTLAKGNAVQKRIENDHQSMEDMKELWRKAALLAYDFTTSQASYYWFACQGGDQMMMMMMIGEKWKVRHELIWLKNNHVLGRTDYNYKHEPILYGWKRDGTHKFFGGFQTSVLEYDKPLKSDLHPTMKPVPLVSKLIQNSSRPGDLVYDSFLGSGTTMIGANGLNRRCFGCELDPGYTAVVLERMKNLGVEPINLIGQW